ncbi:hypothetical protein [Sphingomonas sp.]|jgi:hypothetical protein|uniref:hypothetical protein n=1 Tax=Sphingomonas sp. TaxID=28214 RepID=UPI002D7E81D4|nr:hypothetical protein [Sphingomonas sp.]HEU0043265.1 hypothetical protein [Sphingomonas sp.]
MPETEMIVTVTLAICLVLIVALGFRAFNLRSLHRTVMVAIEQGSPDASVLIDRLGQRPRVNLRLVAYVLIALALAIVGAGLLEGNLHDLKEAVVPALFPGLVGVAILLYLRGADRAGDA